MLKSCRLLVINLTNTSVSVNSNGRDVQKIYLGVTNIKFKGPNWKKN